MHVSPRCFALAAALLVIAPFVIAQNTSAYPSETPEHFQPTNAGFDYQRRDVMIPMRDGVKLHTVILIPNGAKNAPILFNPHALRRHSAHLAFAEFASRPHPPGL